MNRVSKYNRRSFLRNSSPVIGASLTGINLLPRSENHSCDEQANIQPKELADNPLVLFDNFHNGNRRSYSYKARFASAKKAGFDGFELVSLDPSSDAWKEVMNLIPAAELKIWGLHWTSKACVDRFARFISRDIEKIEEIVAASAGTAIEYISLSLSGTDELSGPSIHESGSARAEERHWERAYRIIGAFDQACEKHGVRGSLYPHTHWICDTPQSQEKIIHGASAQTIGPAFCSHHWYANKASLELEEVFHLPMMQRLNYVVLTNGRFAGNSFPAVQFDRGEIDMAWLLAHIYRNGYRGPISSQGWGIGGDPFLVSKAFVDTVRALRNRFQTDPELWPLG
jgi:sugar phosphate isomerase/epimerase